MLTPEKIQEEIDNILMHGNNRADISTLADLYVCLAGMKGEPISVAPQAEPEAKGKCITICGRDVEEILPSLEELIEAIQAINPRLYSSFMDRIQQP